MIITDHSALKWLQTSKLPKGRRARWVMELQQYDFSIKHRPGKANSNADALSRREDIEPSEMETFCITIEEPAEAEKGKTYEADSEDNNDENLISRSPRPWECCGQIVCECARKTPISYDEDYLDLWEEVYSNYSDELPENPNGWGPEFYNQEYHQEASQSDKNDWMLPQTPEEGEIDQVWGLETIAYNFTTKELDDLYDELIKTKWIIAGQPVQ